MQHELLAESPVLRVYAIKLADGTCPAGEWIDGLSDQQAAAILQRVVMFSQRGWLQAPKAFNNLAPADPAKRHPRVDEIKHVGQNLRLYVVDYRKGAREAFVTHGTYKPNKKQVAIEVARARKIFEEGMKS